MGPDVCISLPTWKPTNCCLSSLTVSVFWMVSAFSNSDPVSTDTVMRDLGATERVAIPSSPVTASSCLGTLALRSGRLL